jgi:hypothetical protein
MNADPERFAMEATKLQKMMHNIEDSLAAISFAEEGQAATARSIMNEGRRVLLGLKEGRIDVRTLKYALNTAKRIEAQLDILFVSANGEQSHDMDPKLSAFESELVREGIGHRVIQRTGCLKQQIIDYTTSEKNILFAVIESPNSLDLDCNKKDKTLSELWRKLSCPLVVVMEQVKV